ncbi:MAG: hypothetical protein HPY66_0653 [Firmicutes bacterium]|nr:hypothetical protein [Bacillota bacterium]MDI6706842.1 tetratricopeptide repeat protein [Bacillota bacterium]
MRKIIKFMALIMVFALVFSAVALAKPNNSEPKEKRNENSLSYRFAERMTFKEKEQKGLAKVLEEDMIAGILEEDVDSEEGDDEEETDEGTEEEDEMAGLLSLRERLRERLEQNEDDVKALRKMAIVQKNLGSYEEALGYAERLLAREGERVKAMIILAQVYRNMGETEKALEYLDEILEEYPDAKVRAYKAILLEEEEDLEEAINTMEEAVEEDPDTLEYYEGLGEMYRKANRQGVKVFVDGKKPEFDVPPVIRDGRTLIPVRAVVSSMGAEVDWDPEEKIVTIVKDGKTITLKIDSQEVYVDGEPFTLDVPATIIDGRTLVPGRFVSEAFNALVHWIGDYEMVVIDQSNDNSGYEDAEE